MRRMLLLLAVAILGVGAATQSTSTQSPAAPSSAQAAVAAPTVASVPVPTLTVDEQKALARRFSPERLAALRTRVQADAQRAVRDEAEQGFRAPTADEAAALARPSSDSTGTAVALAGGGVALKADATSLEFVKVTVGKDGTVVTHDGKGARRDQ